MLSVPVVALEIAPSEGRPSAADGPAGIHEFLDAELPAIL